MQRIAITPGQLAFEPDQHAFANAARALTLHAIELAEAGVETVLIREKALSAAQLTFVTAEIVTALRDLPTRVVTAGEHALEAAVAAGAHGVHIGSVVSADEDARRIQQIKAAMPMAWITASGHTTAEVGELHALAVSAILLAPVFGKWIAGQEVVKGLGLEALRQACVAASTTPVFALGGVTQMTAQACVNAGAAGIAAIRMFRWPA